MHDNDWYARHARRQLQERRPDDAKLTIDLTVTAQEHKDETRRLRALWALHAIGRFDANIAEEALKDSSPAVRGWAVQIALEDPDNQLLSTDRLVKLAEKDESRVVRRAVASALQRMSYSDRERVLDPLLM